MSKPQIKRTLQTTVSLKGTKLNLKYGIGHTYDCDNGLTADALSQGKRVTFKPCAKNEHPVEAIDALIADLEKFREALINEEETRKEV